ncbi:succinyl-diaminopimelate desuccinylase [Helicobacter hepaticus]|jgi:succinyl-diaminopimelate desuccinylase|uniref:Succinyl-diaminopimelate desuccinylase n=1 Tax=Helicobacter hepaticus (strain ATCC 51449 / 3B1) TaxID=235279 RepID=DAPE_HELHP|nr:succinyl-diaminopimelate desuccinylase [Helicobacter hepaticus]Q7VF72.1 RecName: Full=Succinyl-diaminopimelate desuccinylase; Short=SDAP desuccinylase; AltName: Full=N-succinyl-LL-2,6-diaminoheptanedioate amidohydrolase [Helicobacter hepaticus ATCC 51449]AAP78402.1 succinyl-diaminopimelate desuccinylase [Helicobacter hepaticus ATCC 51449]
MPLSLLQELIKRPSITPQECGIYEIILNKLNSLIQKEHIDTFIIEQEKEGVKNLFYLIAPKGADKSNLHHFCFAGHIDVVPTGEGWEFEPFCGTQDEKYIYGRGTQDMKGGISAFICAVCNILESHNTSSLPIMLSILLTSDEEGEGIYGTKFMLEELKKRDLLPHSCIVAEPTSINHTGDMLKIGRRGSINGTLIIEGKQGHVAYPQKCINPIELLGSKLGALAGIELDNGDSHFAPSKLVITDIRSGMEVVNVTPQNLKIMFNVRNSPLSNEDSIRSYITSILGSLPYELTLKTNSLPFITADDSEIVKSLCAIIERTLGITPQLSTSGGTSDARFFASYGVNVVEIGVPNDRIHAINERVSISDILALHDIFVEFLQLFIKNAKIENLK